MPRERDIQGKVVGYARGLGVIARKLSFGEGWPDYMLLYKGRILFIEFKGSGGRLRPLQEYMGNLLRKEGFEVLLIESFAEGAAEVDAFVGNSVVDYGSITKALVESKRK